MANEEYVLGVGDEELQRLGLQHRVWRRRAMQAWERAGFSAGQHLIDVGCGPGFATDDLAAIAGPAGRVTAIDQSSRFLDALVARGRAGQATHLNTIQRNLDVDPLPALSADGAWCRWVFAFVREPRQLLARIRDALKPGGALVIHEYFDYGTWRLSPPCPEVELFVEVVMKSWRASGGEPDIGLDLLRWLPDDGFRVVSQRPLVDIVSPDSEIWSWPDSFISSGLHRLVELGALDRERALAIESAYARAIAVPGVQMVTPALLELVAIRE